MLDFAKKNFDKNFPVSKNLFTFAADYPSELAWRVKVDGA